MFAEIVTATAAGGAALLAWGVRGKSSSWIAPSVWRGPKDRRAIAITLDDGPSESTGDVLNLLDRYGARATFFQCGEHVRRLPQVARSVLEAGHEIGNHTETHAALYLRSAGFIYAELQYAQQTFHECLQVRPVLFRPPYGVRWFGLASAQRRLGLTTVMWTMIARDWTLPAQGIVDRLKTGSEAGAIFCLHDGRERQRRPDIQPTLGALRQLLPYWQGEGYEMLTVSDLLCLKTPQPA